MFLLENFATENQMISATGYYYSVINAAIEQLEITYTESKWFTFLHHNLILIVYNKVIEFDVGSKKNGTAKNSYNWSTQIWQKQFCCQFYEQTKEPWKIGWRRL